MAERKRNESGVLTERKRCGRVEDVNAYLMTEREKGIMAILTERGTVSVPEVAEKFEVSEVTARSDLKGLEEKGLLSRTRGGAVPVVNRGILERQSERLEEKSRIAKAAAELVRDGDVVMIEAGTTTALIARYLSGRDVHVVTNSMLAFNYARGNPAVQVTVTGGEFRKETESMVGPLALDTLARMNVRWAFVGTDGFSVEKGMTTHLLEGAEIVRAMKSHAKETVLVADSTKYGKAGFASVLPLAEVDLIITDSGIGNDAVKAMKKLGIEVRVV